MSRRRQALILALGAAFALSLLVSGWAIYDRFSQTNARRAAQARVNNENRETWHKVLCFARDQALKSQAPPAQKQRTLDFYKDALKLARARPCPPPQKEP